MEWTGGLVKKPFHPYIGGARLYTQDEYSEADIPKKAKNSVKIYNK